MTSKEALKDIKDVLDMLIDFARLNINEDIKKQKFEIIKKYLDLFAILGIVCFNSLRCKILNKSL